MKVGLKRLASVVLAIAVCVTAVNPAVVSAKKAKPALNVKEITVKSGETKELYVKNYKGKIGWIATDKTIADVNDNGTVLGVSEGKTVVKAKLKKGGKVLKCKILVSDKEPVKEPIKPPTPSNQTVKEEDKGPAKEAVMDPDKYVLSNPNATEETKAVYTYLCDNFGKYMISCQQESTWMGSPDYEMNIIEEATGKLPLMRGLDYMHSDFKGVNERAIEWWNKGGLVTICWHTGVKSTGYNECKADNPDFDKLFTEGTEENKTLMESWEKAADALAELQEAGVVVLWRPFHEFDGEPYGNNPNTWFWWGKGGAENFVKLWRMQYDYFTNERGLNNLIWVLGFANNIQEEWYVGDEYCDILGSDTYSSNINKSAWNGLVDLGSNKPFTFHECGGLEEPERYVEEGTIWSWFMVWHTDFISGMNKDLLSRVYNSELVLTLDEVERCW